MLSYCIIFFACILLLRLLHKQSLAVLLSFVVTIVSNDLNSQPGDINPLEMLAFFALIYSAFSDLREKRTRSVFIKYNPFYRNNSLPKYLSLILCLLGILASVLKLCMLLLGKGR